MAGKWKKVTLEITTWLVTEICFNLSGLDTLTNYSEFLLSQQLKLDDRPTITFVLFLDR